MSFTALRKLRSPEAAEVGRDAGAIGLIPTGALEQHGPHLALDTDIVIAEELARRIGDLLDSPLIVAPVVPVGLSDHHLRFPGTVTTSEDVFVAVVTAYIEAFERIGIRRIALISAHGGNYAALGRIANATNGSHGRRIIAYSDIHSVANTLVSVGRSEGFHVSASDVHAGLIETSMMLAIEGSSAAVGDLADIAGYDSDDDDWLEPVLTHGMHTLAPSGVMGNPAGANARLGDRALTVLAELLAHWIEREFSIRAL